MRRPTVKIAGLLLSALAVTGAGPTAPVFDGITVNKSIYHARGYGSCTWDSTHDVGACINAAIAAAAAAGGGSVVVPAGVYGQSTAIDQHTSGVHLVGAGVGNPRDNVSSANFVAMTRLVWLGAAGSTMMTVAPASTVSLYSADVEGIVFDCASLANICAKFVSVSSSKIDIGVSEPRITGAWLTTSPTLVDAPGMQLNDISIAARSTSGAYSPTGILVDGDSASNYNVSYNRFRSLFAWYAKGDGIVFGYADSNLIDYVGVQPYPGATGTPVVVASPGYVMPNGNAISSQPGTNEKFLHTGAAITVQGYTVGSTLVAGVHAGSAAVTPVTLTSNLQGDGRHIYFASTAGLGIGMDFTCGNPSNGQPNHSTIARLAAANVEPTYSSGTVASGVSCTFNYGVTGAAVAGTYTITATGATTYNITAPAGGHSQTGVSVASGVLTFTDVVIPMTGSASVNDTFILTVPQNTHGTEVGGVDSINGIPPPYFGPGATGSYNVIASGVSAANPAYNQGLIVPFSLSYCGNLSPATSNAYAVTIGVCSGTNTGPYAFMAAGNNNTLSNYYEAAVGGSGNTLSGIGAFVGGGANNTLSGTNSRGGGASSADRGRLGMDCWATGGFAVAGDAETCATVLRGTTSTTSPVALTSDAAAAGATNCVNIPANTTFAITVTVAAVDHSNSSNNETWLNWGGLLMRTALASSTAVTMQSTPTPLTNGTVTGSALAVTADTTNACLTVTFTPPSGNTSAWRAIARVTTTEVQ